tara:strand:- start:8 stop:460 length:453 start_codon:yes stop_codon:yes gene_type:complete
MVMAVTAMPLGVPTLTAVTPFFALIAVYFWGVYRPELLPVWVVFGLGVFQDLLTGAPTGMTALVLILVWAVAVSQRRVVLTQSFGVEWAGFMLVAGAAGLIAWITSSIYYTTFLWSDPFAVQTMLTAALYPVLSWLLGHVARLAPPMRQI